MIESPEQTATHLAQSFLRIYPGEAAKIVETLPAPEIELIVEREEASAAAAVF
jgi:hypothetical protein